jgi:hypothetical protein
MAGRLDVRQNLRKGSGVHPALRLACLSILVAACDTGESQKLGRFGNVLLQSDTTAEATRKASAYFYAYDAAQSSGGCDIVGQTPECNVWSCTASIYTEPPALPPLSVGDLTVTGTKEPLFFSEGEPGHYNAELAFEGPLWEGADPLLAHVGGSSDFPLVEVGLKGPFPLTVTAPEPVDGMLMIDGKADYSFTWSEPKVGAVYVAISTETTTTAGEPLILPGVDCVYAAEQGKGVIPSAVLKALPKPEGLVSYTFDVLTFTSNRAIVDDAALTLRATTFGLSARASVTF